jgi:pyruvate formate lyase activating enzyme
VANHIENRRQTGRVFNIQRYSLHDGAGIRTLVFLKGCPLTCLWCSNPESQKAGPELGFIRSACKGDDGCRAPCVPACPEAAITLGLDGIPQVDRGRCTACGECVDPCPEDALKVVGKLMTVAEVMEEVDKDRPFYRRSGGGVTLGGGDPLMQPGFTRALLEEAREECINTALETSAYLPWDQFEPLLHLVDQLYIDLKHMNDAQHRKLTGKSNALILDNLSKVSSVMNWRDIVIRIPLIPGCNDSIENILESARFVAEHGYRQIELMPYHSFGVSKYCQYGREYRLADARTQPAETVARLRGLVSRFGLTEGSDSAS